MRNNLSKPFIILSIITANVLLILTIGFANAKGNTSFLTPIDRTIQVFNLLSTTKPIKTVYGYLPYWMLQNADYIDYAKLTDIAYFGLILDGKGNFKQYIGAEGEPGFAKWKSNNTLDKVIRLAKVHNVRVALTVISQNDTDIDTFLTCRACWDNALANISQELLFKGITDISIDFEHVEQTNDIISQHYTDFVDFLNTGLDAKFGDSKVVVAAFADSFIRNRITKPTELARVSDGIFIMAYDFHQTTSDNAGPVAPIYNIDNKAYDVKKALTDFKKNTSSNKLILGVPYYGYNFLVEGPDPNSKRLPGNDVLGYSVSQVYSLIKDNPKIPLSQSVWDESSKTPYVIYKSADTGMTRVLHYENQESLREKYKLVINENLAGIGIWALGYDGEYKDYWNLIKEQFGN
ncbi:MAG: glycosyl hydrolase family 18 protein [Patescibacteria group bacterium]